jgi:hypothetical protein
LETPERKASAAEGFCAAATVAANARATAGNRRLAWKGFENRQANRGINRPHCLDAGMERQDAGIE